LLVFQSISRCGTTQWDWLGAKEAVNGSQTTLQRKKGRLITVMDDWGQLQTNATLLKPAKNYHGLFRATI